MTVGDDLRGLAVVGLQSNSRVRYGFAVGIGDTAHEDGRDGGP